MGLFKKNDKQTAVAFVDYEHWFYSYTNKFNMSPNVDEWYNEICSEYKLENLYFYGDFNNRVIGPELEKLSKYTRNVIHTASMKDGVDKDFTDFIILDAIYREAAKKKSPDVFIIFTGDGHFDLVISLNHQPIHMSKCQGRHRNSSFILILLLIRLSDLRIWIRLPHIGRQSTVLPSITRYRLSVSR